jgi:hypothetical protein
MKYSYAKNLNSSFESTDNKDMMDLSIEVDNLLKGAFNEIS